MRGDQQEENENSETQQGSYPPPEYRMQEIEERWNRQAGSPPLKTAHLHTLRVTYLHMNNRTKLTQQKAQKSDPR